MNCSRIGAICICILFSATALCQPPGKKHLPAKRISSPIKIDGVLDDAAWKNAPLAGDFTELRPTPFLKEANATRTETYIVYDNEGVYFGGYLHERTKDSIANELVGRDNFGNNDFIGIVFDTYYDKINGFEYFVTPLGEQMDAKTSPNNEDFSWNAVWKSACKINADGWSFEMFIPYSAIRFGKKNIQSWGLNLVRRRQKSGQQLFWQSIDPNANGFLTQEGLLEGLENIKPPLRLQLSPYLSTYYTHDGYAAPGVTRSKTTVNGGMDIKYGLNQAFTLDMTLIPDFGQVQTDNRVLNLTPFEQKFSENRSFFTEGTELFNKGNLFYSRRIGIDPTYRQYINPAATDTLIEDPAQAKIINATKISGRTQKGLGVGILNAVTQAQSATLRNKISNETHREETMPLTNYNILVLDQTLKHNSSVSLVNTNVWRSGNAYDANVTSGLFDLNNKKNTYSIGGNISFSNIIGADHKTVTGYAHSIYINKTSGRFNFSLSQDLLNKKYDKSDLGYFTNNNTMDHSLYLGYNWVKPKNWYNQAHLNFNAYYGRLVSPIDLLKRKELMYQNMGFNINGNAQTKKLQGVGFSANLNLDYNDFYEARSYGRVFRNRGGVGANIWYESNSTKKYSGGGNFSLGTGGVFNRTSFNVNGFGKIRLNSKFSIDASVTVSDVKNQPGYAYTFWRSSASALDTIIFSRRNVWDVENILSIKYNFTNRMGVNVRVRHAWTKVDPQQFYQLDPFGSLKTPDHPFTENVNQNYNFFSVDFAYNWQFAQGSFFSIVWKDVADDLNNRFERNYVKNFGKTVDGSQFNNLSVRVIYFIDYLTARNRLRHKTPL